MRPPYRKVTIWYRTTREKMSERGKLLNSDVTLRGRAAPNAVELLPTSVSSRHESFRCHFDFGFVSLTKYLPQLDFAKGSTWRSSLKRWRTGRLSHRLCLAAHPSLAPTDQACQCHCATLREIGGNRLLDRLTINHASDLNLNAINHRVEVHSRDHTKDARLSVKARAQGSEERTTASGSVAWRSIDACPVQNLPERVQGKELVCGERCSHGERCKPQSTKLFQWQF